MKDKIQDIVIILSFVSICFFSYKIYNYQKDGKAQEEVIENLISSSVSVEEETSIPISVDFETLKNNNDDIIGWIYSEDTTINYPILISQDNKYYLRRLTDKTSNQNGSIFVDYRNSKDFTDCNTVVYGHNMNNGKMFASLLHYKDQEYFETHKEMYVITPNRSYVMKIFAGFTTDSESIVYSFPKSIETNKLLIQQAKQSSCIESNVEVDVQDTIVTLSTCSTEFENARFVVLGVLEEIY